MSPKRIIRPEVAWAMTGFSRSSAYRLEAQGLFPKRVKIGKHASGYVQEEVEAWIDARIAEREAKEAK